jgi:DNA-binding MarR family transcriptional regulator
MNPAQPARTPVGAPAVEAIGPFTTQTCNEDGACCQQGPVNVDAVEKLNRARGSSVTADDVSSLESFFAFRVSILAKLLDRRLSRLVGERFGLGLAEYRVLAQIVMRPGSTVRAVSARTMVDKAQVSRVVAALEQQSLVVRTTPEVDRRSPVFHPTRSGRALINKIVPLRQRHEAELADLLGRGKAAEVSGAIQSLIDQIGEHEAADDGGHTRAQRKEAVRRTRVAV